MSVLDNFPDAEISEKELDEHIKKPVDVKGDVEVEIPADLLPPAPPSDDDGTENGDGGTKKDESGTETEDFQSNDVEAELSFILFVVAIGWGNVFHMLDKRYLKSGVKKSHYDLTEKQMNELESKARPVLAKWMTVKMSPEMLLISTVIGIGGAQMWGAYLMKSEKEELERKKKKENEKEAETIKFDEVDE